MSVAVQVRQALSISYENAKRKIDQFLLMNPKIEEIASSIPWGTKEEESVLKTLQEVIEPLWDKHFASKIYKDSIEAKLGDSFEKECSELKLDPELVLDTLCFIQQSKGKASFEMLFSYLLPKLESLEECSKFLEILEENKALIPTPYGYQNHDTLQLSHEEEQKISFMVSHPPMLCKPRKYHKTKEGKIFGGYLSYQAPILSVGADQHSDIPLDFLNKSRIPYGINFEVWDEFVANPSFPEWDGISPIQEYQEKINGFINSFESKVFVIELIRKLGIKHFYLPVFYDYRGRNYPYAYPLNPQGIDIDKALLTLPEEPLSERGLWWLCIAAAQSWNGKFQGRDVDKSTFEIRAKCFNEVLAPLFDLPEEKFKEALRAKMNEAENPFCFMHQMFSIRKVIKSLQEGEIPTVSCITHWDATASGSQIVSIWMGDKSIAKWTNLSNTEEREDLYTELAQKMYEEGLPNKFSRGYLKKKIFIPLNYGSINCVAEAFPEEEYQDIVWRVLKRYPAYSFSSLANSWWNKNTDGYSFHTPDSFYVQRKNRQKYGNPTSKRTKEFRYQYKNQEFYINFEVVGTTKWSSRELAPNITHSADAYIAREIIRRISMSNGEKTYIRKLWNQKNEWKYSEDEFGSREKMEKAVHRCKIFGIWTTELLSIVNAYNIDLIPEEVMEKLLKELPKKFGYVSEIHDSFGVLPNHVDDLMDTYRYLLIDLCKGRYLAAVHDDLMGNPEGKTLQLSEDALAESIAKSKYALC